MKTAHYLLALAACTLVVGGTLTILYAEQDKPAPATPVAPADPAAPKAPEDPNMGFPGIDQRASYAIGFSQGDGIRKHPEDKIQGDAFLRGFIDGLKGEDSSYAEGMVMAGQIKRAGATLDVAAFTEGFNTGQKGEASRLTEAQIRTTMREYQSELRSREEAKAKAAAVAAAEPNKKAGAAFMAENAKKEGWKTAASGMQYRIIEAGAAERPQPTDTVTALYEGSLIDGTVFDSTAKHNNEPLVYPLNRLIPAWGEAMAMIGRGGKMEIVVPSDLAYGDEGSPPTIPPGATLRFSFTLIDFKPAAPAPAPGPGAGAGGPGGGPGGGGQLTDAQLQELLKQLQQQGGGAPPTP